MNVCVMDSPELKELYNSVKDTGESYESIKNLVNVWQLRKFHRNKNFDFTELPTKQDIENLLKERNVPNIDSASDIRYQTLAKEANQIIKTYKEFDESLNKELHDKLRELYPEIELNYTTNKITEADLIGGIEGFKKLHPNIVTEARKMSLEEAMSVLKNSNRKSLEFQLGKSDEKQYLQRLANIRDTRLNLETDELVPEYTKEDLALMRYLDTIQEKKHQNAVFRWYYNGIVNILEDKYKINAAIELANKHNLNLREFETPMEVINTYSEKQITVTKSEQFDLYNSIPQHLSNPKDNGNYTVYDVADSVETAKFISENIIAKYFERSPWCIFCFNGSQNHATYVGAYYWNSYTALPRKIAFDNETGKPIGMFATGDANTPTWWDTNDRPNKEVIINYKDKFGYEHQLDGTLTKGSPKNGKYEVYELVNASSEDFSDKNLKLVRTEYRVGGNLHEKRFYLPGFTIIEDYRSDLNYPKIKIEGSSKTIHLLPTEELLKINKKRSLVGFHVNNIYSAEAIGIYFNSYFTALERIKIDKKFKVEYENLIYDVNTAFINNSVKSLYKVLKSINRRFPLISILESYPHENPYNNFEVPLDEFIKDYTNFKSVNQARGFIISKIIKAVKEQDKVIKRDILDLQILRDKLLLIYNYYNNKEFQESYIPIVKITKRTDVDFNEDAPVLYNPNIEIEEENLYDFDFENREIVEVLQKENNRILGVSDLNALSILIDVANQKQDTLPHEYAHHYINWFRNSELVQEGIKEFGSEEKLVQAIGEQVIARKGKAYTWWEKFVSYIKGLFKKEPYLLDRLTDAFLRRTTLEMSNNINNLEKELNKLEFQREEDNLSERTINYTPIGKNTQTYTIKKSDDGNYQIINKEGKEVFKEDSKDRRRIFANLAVQEKRAVVVEHKSNKYVVNGRNEIISVATGDLMKWGDENGNRKAILEAAKIKFDKLKVQQKTQWAVTSDNNYEVSSAGDSRFSAFNAKLKPGTKILGVTVPEEKSTFIAGKSTTTNSIEYVYQTLIKKSSKGVPPPKNSMLYNESLKTKEEKEDYSYNVGYLPLWQEWASQNPELIEDLRAKSAGKVLTDKFANTRVSQARALADILNSNNTQQSQPQQTPIPENLKETPETVAQNINKEEQSSYVKRNVKAEIISQLEEELKDFGTFERRQDRINFILRFIRNQKKAYFKEHQQILQNKINDPSTTERDRKNYQKLLNNLDADEIFANNIDTIINRAKQALSPESVSRTLSRKLLEKGYPDFNTLTEEQQEQKITEDFNYRTQEFAKIQKHWNSLMEDVKSTLRVVDGYVIDFVKSKEDDNKDNQSEGEGTVKDNWMYEARKIDQRESLSKKVKTIINNIPILDRNGKQEIDDLGYPRFMNAEEVTSTLFYELSNARSCEHFWQKLNNLPNKKPWSKIIVDTINKEGNYEIKSQFYQNFRKESIPYWSQIWTKKGKITTKKINRGGKNNQLLEDWKDNIESGTILTPNSIYGENGKPNVEKAAENLKTLGKLVIEFKSKGNKLGNTNNLNTLLDLINSVGIEITTDELTRSIQNYPQKTEKIFNSLHTIFSKVSDNKTILSTTINNVVVYDNIVEKLDTQYNLLATLIDFDVKSIELQSFRELGDTYQSVSAPSYLGTLISNLTNTENEEEFKQFFEKEFGQYTQFKDKETGRIKNEWLSILYNKPEERKNLERKVVLHSNRKEFNKQTPQEYLLGMLVEFIQPDINYAYYALPLLSDADSEEFIKFVRYTDGSVKNERGESISYKSIINEKLAQAIKDEYDRILMVNRRLKSNAETITTFDSRGTKFTYFPELNDITVNADGVINGEGENKLFKDALDYLTNTKQDLLPFISKVMGQIMDANSKEFISDAFNIANVELISEKLNMTKDSVPKLLDNFFYNYALANINMIQLLTTDLAYYKNTIDFFKRFKEVYASTLKLDTTAKFVGENGDEVKGSKTQSVMILKDNIIKSPSYDSIKSILEGRVQAGAITTRQMNDLLEAYSKVNVADAQGYRTLKSYRKLMVMAGRWNKKLERSYQRLKNGTFDFDDFNSIFNTIKPFCYSQRPVASQVVYTNESTNETVEYGNLKVPIQIKDSEVVLLAMYSTLVSPLNKSERLVGLNKFMDDNDIDIVVFESGVKAGGQGIIDINNVENTYEALKNTVLTNGEKNPFYIHNISTEDLGIQVETPDHLVDVEQLIGSQIKKLIQGDIDVNNIGVTFRLNEGVKDREKTMNKQEMLSHINKLLSSNIIDSFEDLREEFSSLDKVAETLQKELKGNSRYTKDLIVACSLVETTDQIGNVIKEFALPLNDATQFSRIENLLTSLFKNQVIKQKIRGGSPIQFSCYGVSDDLHIEMTGEGTERRIKWVDCYMPAYTKEFFKYYMTTDENGNQFVDINKVPEELKRLVGYRVPTEARYSMLPLRIKGFLPSSEGSKIMVPADITTIAGSDFDVDKLYVLLPTFYTKHTKNGDVLNYVKYDYSKTEQENSKDARNNELISCIFSVLTNEDSADKLLTPGGFDIAKQASYICNIFSAGKKTVEKLFGRKINTEEDAVNLYYELFTYSNKKLGGYNEILNAGKGVTNPITQVKIHDQNATGGALIGVYANHNVAHSMFQNIGNQLEGFAENTKPQLAKTVVFNDKEYKGLTNVKNYEGHLITTNIANFLAASVDNAKDPVLKALMQNNTTANTACLMLRLGIEPITVGLFLNQPIIKEILSLVENGTEIKEAIKVTEEKYKQFAENSSNRNFYKMFDSDLAFNLLFAEQGKDNPKFNNYQFWVLKKFKYLYKAGDYLGRYTNLNKADTQNGAAGPSIAEVINKLTKIYRFNNSINNVKERLVKGKPVSTPVFFLPEIGSKENFIGDATEYSILHIPELLENYLPYFSDYVSYLINTLADVKNTDNESDVNEISDNSVANVIKELTLFSYSRFVKKPLNYYLNDYLNKFIDLKNKYPELSNNLFFKRLKLTQPLLKKGVQLRLLQFSNAGSLSKLQKEQISKSWEMLNRSDNEEIRTFMNELFDYFFYVGGFNFNAINPSYLTPISVKLENDNYVNSLKNIGTLSEYELILFKEQFILHHLDEFAVDVSRIIPSITLTDKQDKEFKFDINKAPEVFKTIETLPNYIKIIADNKVIYYEYNRDSDIYVHIKPLGLTGKVFEYNIFDNANKGNLGDIKQNLNLEGLYKDTEEVPKEEASMPNKSDSTELRQQYDANIAAANGSSLEEFGFGTEFVDESKSKKPTNKLDSYNIDTEIKDINDMPICGSM